MNNINDCVTYKSISVEDVMYDLPANEQNCVTGGLSLEQDLRRRKAIKLGGGETRVRS
jgi:hypothetical protein